MTHDSSDTRYWIDMARQGTEFFDGFLAELDDADLEVRSDLDGWTRKHIIGHLGYNAFALSRLVEWAKTGVETRMYASTEQRNDEIEKGATLSPQELRELHAEGVRSLSEAWDSIPEDKWAFHIVTAQGVDRPVSATPWMRNREVWIHAVDLNNGATFGAFPTDLLERLLTEVWELWDGRGRTTGLALQVADGPSYGEPGDGTTVVSGPLAAVTRWAAGRGEEPGQPLKATKDGEAVAVPSSPRWL